MFNCATESPSGRFMLAAGGRYDSLILDCRPKSMEGNAVVHAVGFALGVDALSNIALRYQTSASKHASRKKKDDIEVITVARRCDVLVTATTLEVLRTYGVQIVSMLWNNNIRAELEQIDRIDNKVEERYGWVVTVKHGIVDEKLNIKVKNTAKRDDSMMQIEDVVRHLNSEMGAAALESYKKELFAGVGGSGVGVISGTGGHRMRRYSYGKDSHPSNISRSAKTISLEDPENSNRVNIVVPPDNSGNKKNSGRKGFSKATILESAIRKVSEFSGGTTSSTAAGGKSQPLAPILAIYVSNETLEALRITQFQGAEAWKKVMQESPAADKGYMSLVQDALMEMKAKAKSSKAAGDVVQESHCYIYSFMTGKTIFYYLC